MEDCSKHAFSKYFLLAHKSITHLGQETMRLPSIKCNRGYDSCFYGLKVCNCECAILYKPKKSQGQLHEQNLMKSLKTVSTFH